MNDYGFDVQEQATKTYTGMGDDINVHDQWAIESQGYIQDRTREHLGQTDKGIVMFRRLLVDAIERNQKGETPLMVLNENESSEMRGPSTMDGVSPAADVQSYWRKVDADRRHAAPWAG